MDKEQAYKIGLAFKLGIIYARGKSHARQLANDDAKWITVHPNGKENKGRPALLDSETGEVLGGMGGKFNGKHISAVPEHGKNEQMGAQMRVNAKSHKAYLMNGQKIDFIKNNPNTQKNNQPAENQTINKQNNKVSFNGYDFDNVSEAKDFLYDVEKNIRGHKEDIATNTTKLKQANKDLAKLQTLDRFYQDYKKDNPLFEKSFTEYLKDNKANYKGIKANELPDLRSSKYWGGGYQDSERAINTLKNAYERVSDNLKRKNTEIRDLNRNIEYAKERIPRLQKLIKMGNETLSKIEK